ncbi:hypothetical protein BJX65DRAFT_287601 [Aspergillus insuetus]
MFVRYCRKHYQRARYRSEAEGYNNNNSRSGGKNRNCTGTHVNNRGKSWTDRQCELVIDALEAIRKWGKVQGFKVGLRKREVKRIESNGALASASGPGSQPQPAGNNGHSNTPSTPSPGAASNTTSTSTTTTSRTGRQRGRQRRPSVASPVPQWLTQWITQHEGHVLSFDQVIQLVENIQTFIPTVVLQPGQDLRFPDIEIIPVYFESRTDTPSGSGSGSGARGRGRGQGRGGQGNNGRDNEQSPTPESGSRSRSGPGPSHPRGRRKPHSGAFSGFPKNRDRKG